MIEEERTLLIVDDEPDMCMLLRKMLRRRFGRIECAPNLTDAGLLAQILLPDVILLDNNLPDGYGLEYIDFFRSLLPNVQIVMISAMDIHLEAAAAGVDYFISKPIDTRQLNLI